MGRSKTEQHGCRAGAGGSVAGKALALVVLVLLVLVILSRPWGSDPVPPDKVWAKAEELGRVHNLDPLLIYSVACAESSLDANAWNAGARGLMQLKAAAWEESGGGSFRNAWNWQRNMEHGAAYLAKQRDRLKADGREASWVLVLASYRHGYGALKRAGYDPARLPTSNNLIYKELFAGRIPSLPGPAPRRKISDGYPPFAAQYPASLRDSASGLTPVQGLIQ